jgi:hypothetical protein
MLSSFAKSFSIDSSAASGRGEPGRWGHSAGQQQPPSAHSTFVRTSLLPLTIKLQKEVRGRKYKVRKIDENVKASLCCWISVADLITDRTACLRFD